MGINGMTEDINSIVEEGALNAAYDAGFNAAIEQAIMIVEASSIADEDVEDIVAELQDLQESDLDG